QLISLRFGTIPIVRATGGLADTITDFDPMTDQGIGFSFEPYDPWQLFGTVVRAVETYRHTATWGRLLRRAMREDVSWARSARQYASLYRSAMAAMRGWRTPTPGILTVLQLPAGGLIRKKRGPGSSARPSVGSL